MLVTTGGLVEQISGSIGGITGSRNRFGQYFRQRSMPVNPDTGRQQEIRQHFSNVTARWSQTLTQAYRNGWNLYGDSVVMKNKLGQDVYLTGFNHYVRTNVARLQAGLDEVDIPPVVFSLPAADSTFDAAISEATQLATITFDDTASWCSADGAALITLMTTPKDVGRDYIVGPTRYMDVIEGDSVTPPTSTVTQSVPFVCSENQKVIVYARIATADGRLSEPFRVTPTVAA